jgi:hypothetical protein
MPRAAGRVPSEEKRLGQVQTVDRIPGLHADQQPQVSHCVDVALPGVSIRVQLACIAQAVRVGEDGRVDVVRVFQRSCVA